MVSASESPATRTGRGSGDPESSPPPSESEVWDALAEVADPEIPTVSVVDLGVIRGVEIGADGIRVELLPTFVGCPAIELMRGQIETRLARLAAHVEVELTYAEPWTTERITAEGRRKLRESGFAPPAPGPLNVIPIMPVARCPHCDSRRTILENAFGPTLCRAIYYCTDCRQPFEQFKRV